MVDIGDLEKKEVRVKLKKELNDFLEEEFKENLQRASTLSFLTREKQLQKESIEELNKLIEKAREIRDRYIKKDDEEGSNQSLATLFLIKAVREELKMWVSLKEENWKSAWDRLIDAEKYSANARNSHKISLIENVGGYRQKLDIIEKFIFPPQTFLSPGTIVQDIECTICGEDYRKCEHIAGEAYSGQLCRKKMKNFIAREVSIVEKPANKKARITHFEADDGKMRNKMTWKKIDSEESEDMSDTSGEGRLAKGIIMTADEEEENVELSQ